jgi:hypothetical protein
MRGPDPGRLAALAARLDVSPSQLLALAGRIAATPEIPLDAARLKVELARVHDAGAASDAAADLALLGYASYALDDIDRGLDMVWSNARAWGA